jgi:hypothetical protein
MYNAQSLSSATWGNNVIVIRNKVSGDTTTARSCAFQKQPDHANAKVGNTVSWVFDCGKIDQLLGSFNGWNLKSKALNTAPQSSMFSSS